jgi:cysteine desulfurase/selenocysteine lyase
VIYLDNAATTWPKPECVVEAMLDYLRGVGASPGRGSHRLSLEAGRIVYAAREALARLLGAGDPLRVVFTANATEALNVALMGYLNPGDHVVTSSVEHNAVMRPLRYLESMGVQATIVKCSREGRLNPEAVERAIRPNTALLCINHASNVMGTILPVAEIGAIARRNGVLLLVDAAQTAGVFPIDMSQMKIDLLAFTGHKGLLGPQGTGGLCLGEHVDVGRVRPLRRGGTGSNSEIEEQPEFLPDKFEAGTANALGIAGLRASVNYVLERGVQQIREHEAKLAAQLIDGLREAPRVQVHGTLDASEQTATVSFNVADLDPSEAALRLDDEYEIMCRAGLHCAPAAHRTQGTFPRGSVRLSLSYLNTPEQVKHAVEAVRSLATRA